MAPTIMTRMYWVELQLNKERSGNGGMNWIVQIVFSVFPFIFYVCSMLPYIFDYEMMVSDRIRTIHLCKFPVVADLSLELQQLPLFLLRKFGTTL